MEGLRVGVVLRWAGVGRGGWDAIGWYIVRWVGPSGTWRDAEGLGVAHPPPAPPAPPTRESTLHTVNRPPFLLFAAASEFIDVTALSDAEMAVLINDMQVHVLINLVGHTAGARHLVTQWRPSPVQAMHYGYPASTALPNMDYMQLDVAAAPPQHRQDFSERFAYFPHSHFIAAHSAR